MRMFGYSYVEVLVAAVILSTAIVPSLDALREVSMHAVMQRTLVEQRFESLALFETVLAEPFGALEAEAAATGGLTPASYSDPSGTQYRRVVTIAPYDVDDADGDGDPSTGTDAGIVFVSLEIAELGILFNTLRGESS